MIFQDIWHKLGEKEETETRKYFVAIQSFEDVIIFGKTNITLKLGNIPDVKWMCIKVIPPLSASRHTSSVGFLPGSDVILSMQHAPPFANCKEIPCRVHTRTVFVDVGIPLYEVHYLAESLKCISNSQRGKQFRLFHLLMPYMMHSPEVYAQSRLGASRLQHRKCVTGQTGRWPHWQADGCRICKESRL